MLFSSNHSHSLIQITKTSLIFNGNNNVTHISQGQPCHFTLTSNFPFHHHMIPNYHFVLHTQTETIGKSITMALNLNLSLGSPSMLVMDTSSSARLSSSHGSCVYKNGNISTSNARMRLRSVRKSACFSVRSSLEATGATVTVGQVTEVNKDTFWPIVKAAEDKTVVLDMYTQWCGPCKVMAPKFQELSEKYLDVVFLKLDCNQENKPLAKELGIRVVPTFKILKDNKVVKEVTGAKFDDLVVAIDTVRSG
ncbi:unnamed protein product [Lupinus luteus]|uniref:Thioredoxin domain-containing protein n=1 Tax=Lupinus luteus TaxID=3873 RepID=A0AAV1W2A2_LUPLU